MRVQSEAFWLSLLLFVDAVSVVFDRDLLGDNFHSNAGEDKGGRECGKLIPYIGEERALRCALPLVPSGLFR